MKPEAQRIAIAEACGWKIKFEVGFNKPHVVKPDGEEIFYPNSYNESYSNVWQALYFKQIPDYITDLNAIHEAEKVLTEDQQDAYLDALYEVCNPDSMYRDDWRMCNATAAQRAEAFLRTVGKWKE